MKISYERVSTTDQSLLRQDVMMEQQGVEKFFTEKISGKNMERPELKRMLEFVREGDTLIVESISRLARSTKDFLEILEQLEKKKVALVSLKEKIDTTTPTGRFIVSVFAALSELEREQTLARLREGINAQKAKGIYTGGRPKVEVDDAQFRSVCQRWTQGEITATEAMKELNLKRSTFYRKVKDAGIVKEPET